MAGYVYAPDAELDSLQISAIEEVSRDYWEAWYSGDAELMERCLHPDWDNWGLVHRILDTRTEYVDTERLTQSQQVELTRTGIGGASPEERVIEVTVLAATHHLASVKTVGKA